LLFSLFQHFRNSQTDVESQCKISKEAQKQNDDLETFSLNIADCYITL